MMMLAQARPSLYIVLAILHFCDSFTLLSQQPLLVRMLRKTGLNTSLDDDEAGAEQAWTSLAGEFLVECQASFNSATMSLKRLTDFTVDGAFSHSPAASAWAILHGHVSSQEPSLGSPTVTLTADFAKEPTLITITQEGKENQELIHVLARVLAQWCLKIFPKHRLIQLPDGTMVHLASEDTAVADIQSLFGCQGEVVEMVDRFGSVLGMVPRLLVHEHNLLHRGIGLIVAAVDNKNTDTGGDTNKLASAESSWYVHQRTSTKRVFPNLYDMFVGGVCLAGEDDKETAIREVHEELGLSRGSLSDPVVTCIVCTDYNRCFVTLFAYHVDPKNVSIRWQEEEVAWGQFCPYPIIEAAADLSIQRLADKAAWPGRLPAIQSKLVHVPVGTQDDSAGQAGWMEWDFVPDGLLVWEAWLNYQRNLVEKSF